MAIVEKHKSPSTVATPPDGYTTLFIRSDTEVPAIKDSDGNVSDLFIPGDASGVTYTPEDPLNWTDSVDPGQVDDALDDLALRVVTLESANASNSFGTVSVSGQDSVVAEQDADTLTLVAGAGMTITTDAGTDAITFTPSVDASQVSYTPQYNINWTDSEDPGQVDDALDDLAARVQFLESSGGGGGNAFGTITVSGQSDVVAEQASDTLTLVAGSGISLTTNAGSDSVTITASGGSTVGDMLDYQMVRKTADETVTSSTALQDDNELAFSVGANETWVSDWILAVDGATAGDIKIAFNSPAGSTGRWYSHTYDVGATTSSGAQIHNNNTDLTDGGTSTRGTLGAGVSSTIRISLIIVNGVNAGTVRLRWAQGTSSGTATSVLTNSYLEARRVA